MRTLIQSVLGRRKPSPAETANLRAAERLLPAIAALDCGAIARISNEYNKIHRGERRSWPEKHQASKVRRKAHTIAYEATGSVEDTIRRDCGDPSEILWADAGWGAVLSAVHDAVFACAAADLVPQHVIDEMSAPLMAAVPGLLSRPEPVEEAEV